MIPAFQRLMYPRLTLSNCIDSVISCPRSLVLALLAVLVLGLIPCRAFTPPRGEATCIS
jgi:hypothetical protein